MDVIFRKLTERFLDEKPCTRRLWKSQIRIFKFFSWSQIRIVKIKLVKYPISKMQYVLLELLHVIHT